MRIVVNRRRPQDFAQLSVQIRMSSLQSGAPPIDLVDGEQLAETMKELGLGLRVKTER